MQPLPGVGPRSSKKSSWHHMSSLFVPQIESRSLPFWHVSKEWERYGLLGLQHEIIRGLIPTNYIKSIHQLYNDIMAAFIGKNYLNDTAESSYFLQRALLGAAPSPTDIQEIYESKRKGMQEALTSTTVVLKSYPLGKVIRLSENPYILFIPGDRPILGESCKPWERALKKSWKADMYTMKRFSYGKTSIDESDTVLNQKTAGLVMSITDTLMVGLAPPGVKSTTNFGHLLTVTN